MNASIALMYADDPKVATVEGLTEAAGVLENRAMTAPNSDLYPAALAIVRRELAIRRHPSSGRVPRPGLRLA